MEVVNAPAYLGASIAFQAANGTQARILVPECPPMVFPSISGEVAPPYNDASAYQAVRQRLLLGGSRIMSGTISSTDGTNRSVLIYYLTLLATIISGTTTIGSQNILTVGAGWNPLTGASGQSSFATLDNAVRLGDRIMLFGVSASPTGGVDVNDGVISTPVTGVTSSTITVNGTPWTNNAGMTGTAIKVYRAAQLTRMAVPANSGNADATAPVQLLGTTQQPDMATQPDLGRTLGMNNALAVGMVASVSALPAGVEVNCTYARY
jgi:hypothetical protein